MNKLHACNIKVCTESMTEHIHHHHQTTNSVIFFYELKGMDGVIRNGSVENVCLFVCVCVLGKGVEGTGGKRGKGVESRNVCMCERNVCVCVCAFGC